MAHSGRHGLLRLLLGAIAIAIVVTAAPAVPSAAARAHPKVSPTQDLALLLTTHRVFITPPAPCADEGRNTVAAAPDRRADGPADNRPCRLPGRDPLAAGDAPRTPERQEGVDRQAQGLPHEDDLARRRQDGIRRVFVYRRGRRVRTFAAVVGKPSTPTPHGRFFVEESVRMPAGAPGGPLALATSARSNVLRKFDGGPGIAIHGRANLGGTLGTAVSHGCVRLANRRIRWMVAHIRPGVVVDIRP